MNFVLRDNKHEPITICIQVKINIPDAQNKDLWYIFIATIYKLGSSFKQSHKYKPGFLQSCSD